MAMANIETLRRITPHRARILDLIRDGMKAPAVAEELTISEQTVFSHYQQLETITGCHSTAGLAVWWSATRRSGRPYGIGDEGREMVRRHYGNGVYAGWRAECAVLNLSHLNSARKVWGCG